MRTKTICAAAAVATLALGALSAGSAEARHRHHGHGYGAAIAGGALFGLALGATLARPRYYHDDYAYYDDGYYDYAPPRRYYRAPVREYYPRTYSGGGEYRPPHYDTDGKRLNESYSE